MKRLSFAASIALLLFGCSSSKTASAQVAGRAPANQKAPDTFRVNFDTSRGPFVVEVTRELAPVGADRFYNLVRARFFDGARFFRVVPGFVVQFGMAGDPKVNKAWDVPIQDDPVKTPNARGTVVFAATSRPNSRTTQLFVNLGDNGRLDEMRFAPFGKVVSGMETVDMIYSGAGERPDQGQIEEHGNQYLQKEFPDLDYIKTARIAQ